MEKLKENYERIFSERKEVNGNLVEVTIDEYPGQFEITFSINKLIFFNGKVLTPQHFKRTNPDNRVQMLEEILREHEITIEKLKNQIR